MKIHELKCHPEYFEEVLSGRKPFEVRLNDRNFEVGDCVIQKEYSPHHQDYTGRIIDCGTITYVLKNYPALKDGYVVFGFAPVPELKAEADPDGWIVLFKDGIRWKTFHEGNPTQPIYFSPQKQITEKKISDDGKKCCDCGQAKDDVHNRGIFSGYQCYECHKNQLTEDEECR